MELDHAVFNNLPASGVTGVWGDITSEQALRAAQAQTARILLVTVPDQNSVRLSVERAKSLNPKLVVIGAGGPSRSRRSIEQAGSRRGGAG